MGEIRAPWNGNTWNTMYILIYKTMWLHDLPAPNWPFRSCRMATPTSRSRSTQTTPDSTITWSWRPSHRTNMQTRTVTHLLLAVYCRVQFEDTHVLLSGILLGLGKPRCFLNAHNQASCTLSTIIMKLSLTFQLMQAQFEGKAMAASMAFHSTSWTKRDEISLGYN